MEADLNDRLSRLELEERRGKTWPIFNPRIESFKSFVASVNEHCNAQSRTEADAVRALPLMLTGEWKDGYREAVVATDDWRTAIQKLQAHMLTPERRSEYALRLDTIQQGSMTVAEFVRKIREMSNNAFSEDTVREATCLNVFLRGLSPEIRKEVRRKMPKTFSEAISLAKNTESILALEATETSSPIVAAVNNLTETVNQLKSYQETQSHYHRNNSRWPKNKDGRQYHRSHSRSYDKPPNRRSDNHSTDRKNESSSQQRSDDRQDTQRERSDSQHSRHEERNNRSDSTGYNRGRGSGRRGYRGRGPRISTNFLFAGILMSLIYHSNQDTTRYTFFDCNNPIGGIFISPPPKMNCSMDTKPSISTQQVSLWLAHLPDNEPIVAHKCTVESYRRCTSSILFVSAFNQTLTNIKSTTMETCQMMVRERRVEGKTLRSIDSTTFGTNLDDEVWGDRTFGSVTCVEVVRYVLQTGAVSKFGETVISPLMLNTGNCRINEGICANDVALMLWTPPNPMACNIENVGTFEAQVSNTSLIIPKSHSAFNFMTETTPPEIQRCFTHPVLRTTTNILVMLNQTKPRSRIRRNVAECYALMEDFVQQRRFVQGLTLRQYGRGRDEFPKIIKKYNLTEYDVERQLRRHPSRDISMGILYTMINAEAAQFKKEGKEYPSIIYPDSMPDYTVTEAESWISLAKILFREVRQTTWESHINLYPPSTERPSPVRSYVGSASHINYLKTEYDKREDIRRNLTEVALNSKLQYSTEVMQKEMKENFNRMAVALCETNNRQLEIWLALLRIDPTTGIRAILQRQDVVAKYVGVQILHVTQCLKIEATEIIRSKRIGSICYSHTPILTSNNRTLFISPGTRDIINEAKQIPCAEVSPDALETDNGTLWFADHQEEIQKLPPMEKLNMTQSRVDINSNNLLSNARSSSFPLYLAISFGENLQSLQAQRMMLLRPVQKTSSTNGPNTLEEIARLGGYTFNALTNTIKETAENVTDYYTEHMFTMTGILAALLFVALSIFAFVKSCSGQLGIFHLWSSDDEQAIDDQEMINNISPEEEKEVEYEEAVKPFLPKF
ncbi:hypothetical protein CAEBREN_30374, partial [Caenorhabditis brenneri]